MFFLLGFGTTQQHLAPGEARTCPCCHNTTQWTRMREFKQFTVFFVPVARWKRRQLEVCGICSAVVEVCARSLPHSSPTHTSAATPGAPCPSPTFASGYSFTNVAETI